MLKSIELNGFKSFARRTVINIESPIVAVVGPNGSGKSNAAEAFRFVLGEQSVKSMRGKRGEDLIWGGTDVLPRLGRASVRAFFNNSSRVLNIDFDEVIIERAVHRDGFNEYFINGSKVRLKDVVTLLASANIGASGHHIISQGEADKILNSNIRERKNIIEDALGLKVFQYKKNESQKKLSKTKENMREIELSRREIAPHLKFLEGQVRKRDKTEKLKEELAKKLSKYLANEKKFMEKEKDRLSRIIKSPEEELKTLNHKLQLLLQEKEKREKKESATNNYKEQLNEVNEKLAELSKKQSEYAKDIGRVEGKISFLESQDNDKQYSASKVVLSDDAREYATFVMDKSNVYRNTRDAEVLRESLRKIKNRSEEFLNDKVYKAETKERDKNDDKLSRLLEERKSMQEKLVELSNKYKIFEEKKERLIKSENTEEKKNKDIEFKILEVSAKISDMRAKASEFRRDKETLLFLERRFEEEVREAVALLGSRARDFENVKSQEPQTLYGADREKARREIERMKIKIEEAGVVGDDVVEEYNNIVERDRFLEKELQDLRESYKQLSSLIADLEKEVQNRFKEGLDKINNEFQNFFQILFGGGVAQLRLVKDKKMGCQDGSLDCDDYEQEGVEVRVKLPRKKASTLEVLSGGERALVSIALIFAMSSVNPPPFLILDETDAALDEANSKRYADMVRMLSRRSQLILITHNRETMNAAGELYGITMGTDGVSRLLSVKLEDAVSVAK